MDARPSQSDAVRASLTDFGHAGVVPPPPAGPSLASRRRAFEPPAGSAEEQSAEKKDERPSQPSRVYPFDAELEMAEIEHGKAGMPWSARARTLSTSTLSLSSRRMCYVDRRVVVAIHRVDDSPTMLLGRVADCRYESDGLYTIDLELLPVDEAGPKLSFSRKAI